jgi:hypothetical protein
MIGTAVLVSLLVKRRDTVNAVADEGIDLTAGRGEQD